jgi:hypothetical protein
MTVVQRVFRLLLAFLVIIVVLFCFHATVSPQESRLYLNINGHRLSADIENTPLKKVIDQIKNQKDIWIDTTFMRDQSLLDNDISVTFGDVSMKEGLDRILTGINYSLFYKGETVVGVMLFGKPGKRSYRNRSTFRRSPSTRTRRRP